MNTNSHIHNGKFIICIAASAACAVLSAPVQAKPQEVTVNITVSTADLDLSRPAGAREAYARLKQAARVACRHGMRVDLRPPASFADCYEKALGDAIRSVNQPLLRMAYLATHTPGQAEAYGIEIPKIIDPPTAHN